MQKSNSIFLKNQLTKFLSEIGIEGFPIENFDEIEYIVDFDPKEKQETKTNSDDIMRLWSPVRAKLCECKVGGCLGRVNKIPLKRLFL